jgi:aminoglycoside phosphotransferase (APT) family kinase protein
VERVASAGTVNAVYRLGPDMAVRLPRIEGGVKDVELEARWLPLLAPALPVAIPAPLAKGRPAQGYPWPWAVYAWLSGINPGPGGGSADPDALARDLGAFVAALHRVAPMDGPPCYRSESLAERDAEVRDAIGRLRDRIPAEAATALWGLALDAAPWPAPPVWVHADLSPGNILLDPAGRLSAVIDFGCVGLGDPALDLIAAWSLLPATARPAFRAAAGADEATWTRGRGWALSIALIELAYYEITNPVMAATARHVITQVLADGPTS